MFSVIAINLLTQWVNSDNFIPIKRGKCYEDFHNYNFDVHVLL